MDFERLGKILVVVERLEAPGFEVHEFEVEALGAGETVPMDLGDAWRDEALVGGVHSEGDQAIHESGFASHPWADGLSGHVAAINDGVTGEYAQRSGVASHLEVSVFEDVFVAVEALGLLVEAGERLHLCFDFFLYLPGEV